jgi:NADPH:quinone reductase-like Zn-dependent oxidoreductase
MKMKDLQISEHGLPTDVMELVDISEPDALKAGGLLAAVEYAPITSIYGEW